MVDHETENDFVPEDDFRMSESIDESGFRTDRFRPNWSNRKVAVAGISGVLIVAIVGFWGWYFLLKGEQGRPVPPPRNTSFGSSSGGDEKIPAGEQIITLTEDQLKAAGLKIVAVGETFDNSAVTETTTGVVKANEYEETPVITQVSGVVKSLNADLGRYVRRGETVAVVSSQEFAETQSKYVSLRAELDEAEKRYKRALELSDISEESRNELDRAEAALKAAEAKLTETRSNYERAKKLVEIGAISRRELELAATEIRVAEANAAEAKNRYERSKGLLKINPARRNEIDQFLTRVRNMESDLASVREKLLVLGMPRQRINSLRSSRQISADLAVPSPVSGTITERIANRGEVVSMNGKIAKVTDLSTVWVIGQIYERDLGRMRIGSGASITTESYPEEVFRGRISYIDPTLDEKTRTAQVRIEIQNPNQKLKIGMYVNVAYASLGGSEKTAPLVPKESVQNIGSQRIVFQATDDPKTFVLRPIRIGRETDRFYSVTEGIFVGDRIVADGSFLLRAEFLKTNPVVF